jgi:REP element-mobilizing transposase RayT
MPQSLAKVYLHTVFSTKYRQPLILPEVEESLYNYIGGIIKSMGGYPLIINGVSDHIHILSTLPRTVTIAKYLEEIKKNSSKWIKTQGPDFKSFAWQNGYGTFSVNSLGVGVVTNYIRNQKRHHNQLSFKEEVIQILDEYDVEYDEKYLWD